MGMKGFITGSLVTLGVVGLVAALKDADFSDFDEDFDGADGSADKTAGLLDFDGFADDDGGENAGADKAGSDGGENPMSDGDKKAKVVAMQEKVGKLGEELSALLSELNGAA